MKSLHTACFHFFFLSLNDLPFFWPVLRSTLTRHVTLLMNFSVELLFFENHEVHIHKKKKKYTEGELSVNLFLKC